MLRSKAETHFTHYIFPKSVCDIPVVGGVWYVCEFVVYMCDTWYVVCTCVSSLPSGVGDVHRTWVLLPWIWRWDCRICGPWRARETPAAPGTPSAFTRRPGTSACWLCQENSGPQRCRNSNPWNLRLCHIAERGIKVADKIMVASYLTQDRKVILCYLGRPRVIIKLNKSRKWRPVSGGDREYRSGSQWEGRKRTYAPSLEAEGGGGPWAKESGGLEKLDRAMKQTRPGSSGWNATPNTSISAPEIYEIYVRLLTSWMWRYCVCVCVCVWVAQSCPTLCDPGSVARQAPLSMGSSNLRINLLCCKWFKERTVGIKSTVAMLMSSG